MPEFVETILDSEKIIHYGGLTLLLIIVFAETGLFFGFFLPGDYLLFTAGMLCGTADLNIPIETLSASIIAAAILGNFAGFATGKFFGKKIFRKEDSVFFKKSYLQRTEIFFEKYGPTTLIFGRYFPIIRTFAPILAGATGMPFRRFTIANITGGVLWVLSLVPLGFYIGKNHPHVVNYLHVIIPGMIIITSIPLIKAAWSRFKIKSAT